MQLSFKNTTSRILIRVCWDASVSAGTGVLIKGAAILLAGSLQRLTPTCRGQCVFVSVT